MTQYFSDDGHLTDDAFRALDSGDADELSRLEISEHLSFCDQCIDRYTAFLETVVLMEPVQPLAPEVLHEVRHRGRVISLRRSIRAVVAACLALIIWFGAVYSLPSKENSQQESPGAMQEFSRQTADITRMVSDSIGNFFLELDLKGVMQYEKEK